MYNKIKEEQKFHDEWASSEQIELIDPIATCEACTSPELRWIFKKLGSLENKKVLDIGCGLGEVSVYFAIKKAEVYSTDLSMKMLNATNELAKKFNVNLETFQSSSEEIKISEDIKFDIIYCGNLLHHVNIEGTILRIKKFLKKDGVFVSWDPYYYNPIINVYRKIAYKVRTKDEVPLKNIDIKLIQTNFRKTELKFFWITTLFIFLYMFIIQRKNPNKVRYWKDIIKEHKSWEKIYYPLEAVDNFLIKLFPFLKYLTWNVAMISKN